MIFSGVFPQEGMHLYNCVRKGGYKSCIEIGCAYGMSALYMGAALAANEAEAAAAGSKMEENGEVAVSVAPTDSAAASSAAATPADSAAAASGEAAGELSSTAPCAYKMLSVDPNQSTQVRIIIFFSP